MAGMGKANRNPLSQVEHISQTIMLLRGQRVILDSELGTLYGVSTKRLNEQVKRNAERFPEDFLFRLSRAETEALNRSQIATGSQKHRNPRYPPFAFTEHGAIMAATILNSPLAVEMIAHIEEARYLDGYRIWLRFDDGAEGEVDLSRDLAGPVFEPLRRPEFFRSFQLHPEPEMAQVYFRRLSGSRLRG